MIATQQQYGNFVLKLDFQLTSECNSDIVFRVFSLKSLTGNRQRRLERIGGGARLAGTIWTPFTTL